MFNRIKEDYITKIQLYRLLNYNIFTTHFGHFYLSDALLRKIQQKAPQVTLWSLTIVLILTLNTAGCNTFNIIVLHLKEQQCDGNSNNSRTG